MPSISSNHLPLPLLSLLLLGIMSVSGGDAVGQPINAKPSSADLLPVLEGLPDPLFMKDGTRVKDKADWAKRREEIKEMIQYYEYGHLPPAPDHVTVTGATSAPIHGGLAEERRLHLVMGPGDKVRFAVRLVIPKSDHPLPVLLQNTNSVGHVPIEETLLRRGYMIAEYVRTDLAPDEKGVVGCAQAAYPDFDWGVLAVWAWGAMRTVDYLLTLDVVDKSKIAVTGHSRGGKTALLAGALDDRFALVAPNGSGCGGAACFRIQGATCEKLSVITDPERFGYWFTPRFRDFADKETHLPFDQHFLKALVAPRALLNTDALDDHWANPKGTQATYIAAQSVFNFLHAGSKNGIHFREGGHEHSAEDWTALADYADLQFFGKKVERKFNALPLPIQ